MPRDKFFSSRWESKRAESQASLANGQCVVELVRVASVRSIRGTIGRIKVSRPASRVQVTAPYNEEFNRGARSLSGKWRHRTKVWTFPSVAYKSVVDLCRTIYGGNVRLLQEEKEK